MTEEEIRLSFKWGGKDGKWRWLAEVGEKSRAGEERLLRDAHNAAWSAACLLGLSKVE